MLSPMPMKFHLLVFLAFEVFCGACTHAQDISDSTPVLGRGANLVFVPTLIKTSSGEPVFGLTANDFVLTDDGIERKISLEENTGSQPLALVIVVQTGGAGGRRLDIYRKLGPLLDAMIGGVAHRVAPEFVRRIPNSTFDPSHCASPSCTNRARGCTRRCVPAGNV